MPPFKEIKVREVRDLHRGDQIAIDRVAYKHHMIVTEYPTDLTEVSVIQYTNDVWPGVTGIIACSGRSGVPIAIAKVRADVEDISSDVRRAKVYRIDYDECFFSPDEIVQRAKSKLGESKYCPFTNNCEHFATWCKTGIHESSQVKSAGKAVAREGTKTAMKETANTVLSEGAKSVAGEGAKQAAKEGTKTVMKDTANTVVKEGANSVAGEGAKQAAREGGKTVMKETAKTAVKEGSKSVAGEGVKQVGKEGTKTVMKETAKTAVKEGSKSVAGEGAKHVAKEGTKTVMKDTANTVLSEGAKSVAGEGVKQVAREGTGVAMTEAGNEAFKETLVMISTPFSAGQAIREASVNLKYPVVNLVIERAASDLATDAVKTTLAYETTIIKAAMEEALLKETLSEISNPFKTGQAINEAINEATRSMFESATGLRMIYPVKNFGLLMAERTASEFAKDVVKENTKQLAKEGAKSVTKDTAKTALNEGAKSVAGEGAKQAAREGGKTVIKETAKKAVKEGVRSAAREGAMQAAKSGGKSLGKKIMECQGKIGIGLTMAVETYDLYNRTRESKKKRDNGEISQNDFEKQVATHAVKGVVKGAVSLVGSTLGQTLIPIPFVGGMVGGMAGKGAVRVGEWGLQYLTN
ncbi:uncharacterized protein LOC118405946 [Branchiostoma floridae]|uniref:Uncharacterized protein LOC118405946 n=1 Tax=Branchiostoma floridae TaxID=7739 RepID=A0A9J7HNS9_BRAFL|nr:uncharacterized protein LOC118405946 [Branchiostoma floridae]